LLTLGYSVIPSGGGDKGKAPLVNWQRYQKEAPDESQLDDWERELSPPLWGIVTNETICVLEADTKKAREVLEAELGKPHVISPRGGAHWYIDTTGHPLKTKAGLLPGIDIRGVGGFINIAGSSKDGEYKILRLPIPGELILWANLPKWILATLNGSKPATKSKAVIITEGQRNNDLIRYLGAMRRHGATEEELIDAGLKHNQHYDPPLADAEVRKTAKSVCRYPPNSISKYTATRGGEDMYRCNDRHETMTKRDTFNRDNRDKTSKNVTKRDITAEDFRQWVIESDGRYFSTKELDADLSVIGQKQKDNRRQVINRMKLAGEVEKHPKANSLFRYINANASTIAVFDSSAILPLPLRFPLGIEQFTDIYPGNEIVIAGSPNAGKTAFLLNMAGMNVSSFPMPIVYFSSEMGAPELTLRLRKFDGITEDEWLKIVWKERQTNFQDVIQDTYLNIIDYLEASTDLYLMADHLASIQRKATKGLTVVAIQKAQGRDLGRGAEFSSEKPRLYLSMDPGKIKIVKVKNWHTTENPNGLVCKFKLVDGAKFIKIGDWYQGE